MLLGLPVLSLIALFPPAAAEPVPSGTADPTLQLLTWVPEKTWDGTTVFGDRTNGRVVEVDMEGRVVRSAPIPGGSSSWVAGVMVLPNDNILFAVFNPEDRRGAYEVNRQGEIVWSFLDKRLGPDAIRLPSGNTLLTAPHSEDYSAWPYTDPQVFEINSAGQMVWSFHFKDVFQDDPAYKDIREEEDFSPWTHVNSVSRLPGGNTLISPRNFGITIEVDPSGKLVKTYGDGCTNCPKTVPPDNPCALQANRFQCPHSPLVLANGHLLVSEPAGASRVIEFDPATKSIVWQYGQGTRAQGGEWLMVRGAQRLPNGNTLVADTRGQLLEVTADKQVVWKLRLSTYEASDAQGGPFFQAERVGYHAPMFTIQSPKAQAYASPVPVDIADVADVQTIRYSVVDRTTGKRVVENTTYLKHLGAGALQRDPVERTNATLSLPAGQYRLLVEVDSAGWGYKDYLTPKRINHATAEVDFTVAEGLQGTTTTAGTAGNQPGRTQPSLDGAATIAVVSATALWWAVRPVRKA